MFRILLAGLFVFVFIECIYGQPRSNLEKTLADSLGIKWVFIRGGTFKMGDTFNDGVGHDWEKPVHTVTLSDFYLSATEVTFDQYDAFCIATGRYGVRDNGWGRGSRPVGDLKWQDAVAFCEWLSKETGMSVRLPTEAEWEYAARSGGKNEKWAGTSSESALGEYAWYSDNSGGQTHPVATKKPNGLGLYDMSGNEKEWCADWSDDNYYRNSPARDPRGPSSGNYRISRGGYYGDPAVYLRCSSRGSGGFGRYGFRLARTPGGMQDDNENQPKMSSSTYEKEPSIVKDTLDSENFSTIQSEDQPPVPFYSLTEKPQLIKGQDSVYPELAKKAGIEGVVVLKALINTMGDVEKVEVIKSHPLLDDAAIEAVKQYKYKPGKKDGKPIKGWISIPVEFKLPKKFKNKVEVIQTDSASNETEIDFREEIEDIPPPSEDIEEPIVPFYALSEKPVEFKRVNPIYPELAKKSGIEGTVIVKVLVNTRGDVERVEVLNKSYPLLEEAAIEAAKQFKFKAGKKDDILVKVWVSIPFNFRLPKK